MCIDSFTDKGIHRTKVYIGDILTNNYYRNNYLSFENIVKYYAKISGLIFLILYILITWMWTKLGNTLKEKKLISGKIIKTSNEVKKYLINNKIASEFNLNGTPLIKNTETQHILITGSTGSGKSNCLHNLLPQIRAKKQPAIIVDTEGDMVAKYYRPGIDIIINPFDERTHHWNI